MHTPQDAASWANSIENPSIKEIYLKLSIQAWTPQNFYESLDFVQNLPNDHLRATLLNLVCEAAIENHPVEALNLAIEQPDEDKRKINIQNAVAQWAKIDPVNAFDWVLKIENVDLRNSASLHAAEAVTLINPIAAAQFSITHMESGIYQDHILKLAIDQWSKKDPRSTALWIKEFEYSELSLASIEILTRNWMAKDPTEYELWLKELPHGDFRTEATNQFNQMRHSED